MRSFNTGHDYESFTKTHAEHSNREQTQALEALMAGEGQDSTAHL